MFQNGGWENDQPRSQAHLCLWRQMEAEEKEGTRLKNDEAFGNRRGEGPGDEIEIDILRARSFGRIRIGISDLWRSFRANPFSDQ